MAAKIYETTSKMPVFSEDDLENLYKQNGWSESRLRRSFANKEGFTVMNEPCEVEKQGLFFEVGFEQVHKGEDGFEVNACLQLASDMRCWLAYLVIRGKRWPLHDPVEIPVKYGFSAQANQLLTAAIGLQYVYNVAGVRNLSYFPQGMQNFTGG